MHFAHMNLSALLCLAATACMSGDPREVQAPADSAAGEVAFELAGPNDAAIVVPVSVNGRGPFDFVLDTGATLTCIDSALADSLQLGKPAGAIGLGAGAGGTGQVDLVEFDSLRVADAIASDLPGCSLDLAHLQSIGFNADGLLGLNFLKPFRVTIDFTRSVLILQKP